METFPLTLSLAANSRFQGHVGGRLPADQARPQLGVSLLWVVLGELSCSHGFYI